MRPELLSSEPASVIRVQIPGLQHLGGDTYLLRCGNLDLARADWSAALKILGFDPFELTEPQMERLITKLSRTILKKQAKQFLKNNVRVDI